VVVGRPNLKSCLFEVLSVVQKSFCAAAVGFVVHVHLETILIIILRVIADKETFKGKTDRRQRITE
jgi:hypothetical protein